MVLVETTPQEWELRLITRERDEKKATKRGKLGRSNHVTASRYCNYSFPVPRFFDTSCGPVLQSLAPSSAGRGAWYKATTVKKSPVDIMTNFGD